jgi:hypothetical protein
MLERPSSAVQVALEGPYSPALASPQNPAMGDWRHEKQAIRLQHLPPRALPSKIAPLVFEKLPHWRGVEALKHKGLLDYHDLEKQLPLVEKLRAVPLDGFGTPLHYRPEHHQQTRVLHYFG